MRRNARGFGYVDDLAGRPVSSPVTARPMVVECPTCKAGPGQSCTSSAGTPTGPHRDRRRKAVREAGNQAPSKIGKRHLATRQCPRCGARTTATKYAHRNPFGTRCPLILGDIEDEP